MIMVWADAADAGLLDRRGERGSTFAYLPGAPPAREVSVTMPLRLESWSVPFGLLPVFEMNLPEGVLRERLRLAFAKATGTFDEFDLLSIVGRSQVGRIRYTGDKEHLAEDGVALVIDRFDLHMDGTYCGFEDFCVLNARRTDEKYRGSYETSVIKRFGQFANSTHVDEDMEKLFALIVLNCALRNGDAHLKNFGIAYDDVQGEARLAPVYDLVTTSVYLPKDSMALTLNGTTKWASAKAATGRDADGATPARVRDILKRIEAALADTSKELQAYMKAHAEFMEIGNRMLQQWEQGVALSLKAA
jgi:HipA-like protein